MARAGCLGFTPGKDSTYVVGSGGVDFLKPASCMAVGVLVFCISCGGACHRGLGH